MRELEMPRQPLRERAFAGRGSAIDSDDDGARHVFTAMKSAPSARISVSNSGKLVAIMAVSSTLTGSREANPATRNDMAMR